MAIPQRGLRRHLAEGGKAVNGWCSIPSAVTAETVARAGFDTVSIDLQHGLIDYQTALGMLQAVDGLGVPTLARVPWNEPGIVMKVLDAGFTGVICPMVNTAAEAERFASACRYAPQGVRSYGPTRAAAVHGADYARTADGFVTTFAMIETAQAMDNLDAILAVEGIDAVYVGPSDLGLSLGHAPTLLPEAAPVLAAVSEIRDRARAAGKVAAIHCGSAAMVRAMLADGFGLATLVTDLRLFAGALAAGVAEARAASPEAAGGAY